MDQFLAITKNTFLQVVRQPIYGIIVLVTLGGLALAPSLIGWTLDDDNKMLRDVGLSTMLVQGLFLACFAASSVIDTEIEDRTVLAAAAKPVRRSSFILGKYFGVIGALLAAHYLAGIAFFMTMRHGVLQTSAETSDITVLVLGPGLMVLLLLVAAILNYLYEWRYLATLITLSLPCLTLAAGILLVVDRDFKLNTWGITQEIDSLPPEAMEPGALQGIIEFRPDEGYSDIVGHKGKLVRSWWKGTFTDEERQTLLDLSPSLAWKRNVRFLVETAQSDLQGTDILKSAILIVGALLILAAIAVAASTRVGMFATFLICFVVVSAGLASDQVIKPAAEQAGTLSFGQIALWMILPLGVPLLSLMVSMLMRSTARIAGLVVTGLVAVGGAVWIWSHFNETSGHWAMALYRVLPNFQFFWMVDALSESRVIPWSYATSVMGYGVLYAAAVLMLAMALFETREVG